MVDTIIYELANVGLTLLFIVLEGVVISWVGNKL